MTARALKAAAILFSVGSFIVALPAHACEIALVQALDVSSSVDAEEYALQQQGLAFALADRDVIAAIEAAGGIWINVFEWSGARHQYTQLEWVFLSDEASIRQAAHTLIDMQRRVDKYPTGLGIAVEEALARFETLPERCARHIVDISGDGLPNDGAEPPVIYRLHEGPEFTVNGLVIDRSAGEVQRYFENHVAFGPGAFVETVQHYGDFGEAMRRKLLRELLLMQLAQGH